MAGLATSAFAAEPLDSGGGDHALDWVSSGDAQVTLQELDGRVGASSALLGIDLNDGNGHVAVAYDPTHDAAGGVVAAVEELGVDTPLVATPSVLDAATIADVHTYLASPELDADRGVGAAAYYDAHLDAVIVLTPADGPVAAAMRDRFGEAVVVVDGVPSRLSGPRAGDLPAHWAGSQIWNATTGAACTSGFTTYNVFGVRGSLTAAHCGTLGHRWWSSWVTTPPYDFGSGWGNGAFPTQDFQWIYAAGISYTNVIHTDPLTPASRSVTAAADPVLGAMVCVSGAATGATCTANVVSTNATNCDVWGCTPNLAYAAASPWSPVAAAGDSGGPVYTNSGSSNATARGTIVAGVFGNDVFIQKVSTIQGAGLTVLTVP